LVGPGTAQQSERRRNVQRPTLNAQRFNSEEDFTLSALDVERWTLSVERFLNRRRKPLCEREPSEMKLLKTKAMRFSHVIEECGQPSVYTLWLPPKNDRRLQSKIRQMRLMTILRSEGGTEFGSVGFIERKGAMYLVFPKSLKRFVDQRIVGIKWALVKK
jgi:hypothetical protein